MTPRTLARVLIPLALVVPGGCAPPLREVMLIVTTDIDCSTVDRIEVQVSRVGSDAITYGQVFVRAECMVPGDPDLPRVSLADGAQLRLGIQDAHASDARLHVEVRGKRGADVRLTALAETDFVDGKVYGLPVALSNLCFAAQCNAGGTCRPDLGSGGFVCATVYRAPGTSGLAPATP